MIYFIPVQIQRFPWNTNVSHADVMYHTGKYSLDGQCQLLFQCSVILVWRKVNAVEACVTLRQLARVARLLDREATGAIRALQILEAVNGNT